MSTLDIIGLVALVFYGIATTFLASQGLHSLWLLSRFLRAKKPAPSKAFARDEEHPAVLVQLPVFNERDVVARVVATIGALDWPKDRLRIQLLDDGTDDSVGIGKAAIAKLAANGMHAVHVRRPVRVGYKAGALEYGLELDAQHPDGPAPFVAIFDADFVPHADFLQRAIPPLAHEQKLAFVQGRWEHLNPDESVLTRAQAIGIDGHFAIEQAARSWSGLALNFNGTCGVWRRAAIEDAGGWQHDTLTEDLDLSYRAHLKGWRARYDIDLDVPGELPPTLEAWRAQQFRWAKGSLQTARKLLGQVWRGSWPFVEKLGATMHLTHYLVHPSMVVSMMLAPIATLWLRHMPAVAIAFGVVLLAAGLIPPLLLYVVSQRSLGRSMRRLIALPALMSFGTGIALSNARAAWQAFSGLVSPFVRTPKHGKGGGSYRAEPASGLGELGLAAIGFSGLLGIWSSRSPWLAPILLLYVIGFALQGLQLLRARLREAMPASIAPSHGGAFAALGALGTAAMVAMACAASQTTWQQSPWLFAGLGATLGATCFAGTVLARRSAATPWTLGIVIAAGIAMHVAAFWLPLSDDLNRYAVEGAQVLQGENPYAVAPAETQAIELATLPGAVNHAAMTSIYPPPMLALHAWVMHVHGTVHGFRALALGGAIILLLTSLALLAAHRAKPTLAIAIAWNPVLVLFAAGEAHHDILAAATLALAFYALHHKLARTCIVLAALAALFKPFALAALPVLLTATSWRNLWIPPLVALLSYLPFAGAGYGLVASLLTFGGDMQFHGAIEPILRSMIDWLPSQTSALIVRGLLAAMLICGIIWLHRRSSGELQTSRAARSVALLLLCLPTLHPWYFTLLVALLPFTNSRALLAWTVAAPVYWLHGVTISEAGAWGEWTWATSLAHVPFVVWMLAEAFGPLRIEEPRASAIEVA